MESLAPRRRTAPQSLSRAVRLLPSARTGQPALRARPAAPGRLCRRRAARHASPPHRRGRHPPGLIAVRRGRRAHRQSPRALGEKRRRAAHRDRLRQGSARGVVGRPITWFSYPYGKLSDYTHETVSIVREGGFSGACSNHLGVVKPWTDVHRLPRVIVRDLEASEFAGLLEGWFRAPR